MLGNSLVEKMSELYTSWVNDIPEVLFAFLA